jgi:hypothetical protein
MADTNAPKQNPPAVTNEQIKTETKFPRRSFLSATGALVTGALAIASGVRAAAQQPNTDADKDKKKEADPDTPDKKKGTDPDNKKNVKPKKTTDPHKKKPADSDTKKSMEGDWKAGGDPD